MKVIRWVWAVAALAFLVGSPAARADSAQTQFVNDQPLGSPSSQISFDRYDGLDQLVKAEFVAEAAVKVRFYADELAGSGIDWNLYASVGFFGFAGTSVGAPPINYYNGPLQQQTVPASGGVLAEAVFPLGQITTTYTDPLALDAFFVGDTPFTYVPDGSVSGTVDSEIFQIISSRPVEITTTVGVSLFYYTSPIPEPATTFIATVLLAPPLLARSRRRMLDVMRFTVLPAAMVDAPL